jgi:hypothetical protein
MLAFSAVVMVATLVALLLQPNTPLLQVLQDMDMCLPPCTPRLFFAISIPHHPSLFAGNSTITTLSRAVDPCHDFYKYSCGGWTSRAVIPPDQSRIARSFSAVSQRADEARGRVMASLSAISSSKPGIFYKSCMDLAAIRLVGVSPAATAIRNSM